MKSNEIHILWSDYLHKTNPGTIVKQWFQDFLFRSMPPLSHIFKVSKKKNQFKTQRIPHYFACNI